VRDTANGVSLVDATAGLPATLKWANRSADILMRAEYGRIEWFGQIPEKL
jgi:hypothetical protein